MAPAAQVPLSGLLVPPVAALQTPGLRAVRAPAAVPRRSAVAPRDEGKELVNCVMTDISISWSALRKGLRVCGSF